ncbi:MULTISPECIES: cupin domain-containing protein [unclassified Paraburkholderia]|uniref:cupin domain-containing protein n=1 Tax=unclassified Paraburkholderia TaxID=2615204 RepID=UPI001622D395|nr:MULTISPECIES: cupin domain-containing protein [unclassified Paraburkholderia]MBB5448063.1 quercetin dioxygenase-like cupin family protein [Paraburkholderia sp. WSM4177]MBB5488478.1 quercetin dioxygenase-like cupin family protein [Paraburkholderia sp. WSM4180]
MVRRVVTGEKDGKSVIVSDGPVANTHDYAAVPGFQTTLAWATLQDVAPLPHDGKDPVVGIQSVVPDPHGTRLLVVQFPPESSLDSGDFDPVAAGAEYEAHLPGLAQAFEPDGSGMHRTTSVDYDIIVSGELWLELDDGEIRHLQAGDIVIQNGTRHAWRNRGTAPAVMVAVLIGAETQAAR